MEQGNYLLPFPSPVIRGTSPQQDSPNPSQQFAVKKSEPKQVTELQQKRLAHFISKGGQRRWLSEAGERKGMRGESLEFRADHAEGTVSAEPSSAALHMHELPRGMCLLGAC